MNKIYEMVDGIPLHRHLKNGSAENEMMLGEQDYGKFAEFLGIFFNKIDTINRSASYQMCELNKELVNKILQTEEQREIKISV